MNRTCDPTKLLARPDGLFALRATESPATIIWDRLVEDAQWPIGAADFAKQITQWNLI
jgi:hypothetical protein